MKIRQDFVTNSSSSSFILAIKTGVDATTVRQYVKEQLTKQVKSFVDYEYDWLVKRDDDSSYTEDKETNKETLVQEILQELEEHLREVKNCGMSLPPWNVECIEASNESNDIIESFLYSFSLPETDWLKLCEEY